MNQDAQYRVFFVCGPPKAGTTWVQHILDAHPKISCSGEGHFHTKVGKPFVAAMCEYNRFQGAVDDVVYRGHSSHVPISHAEMGEVVKNHILWLMIRRGVPPGVIWLGDKTPGYTEALPILHGLFPDARFVHVIRDPRDVLVSRVFQRARTGANPNFATSGDPLYYKTAEEVAVGWQLGTERVHRFKSDFPGLVHEVRYEDLLERFRPTARALFDFFAAELSDEKLAEIEHLTAFEAMTGVARAAPPTRSRFSARASPPIGSTSSTKRRFPLSDGGTRLPSKSAGCGGWPNERLSGWMSFNDGCGRPCR